MFYSMFFVDYLGLIFFVFGIGYKERFQQIFVRFFCVIKKVSFIFQEMNSLKVCENELVLFIVYLIFLELVIRQKNCRYCCLFRLYINIEGFIEIL